MRMLESEPASSHTGPMLRPLPALFLLFAAAIGCAPSQFTVQLLGADDLNPDPFTKTPSPVQVRAYFTRGRQAIEGAEFEALWVKEGEALGGELVTRAAPAIEVPVGKNQQWLLTPPDGAKFVTLVAKFNKIDGKDWRVVMDFDQAQSGPIEVGAYAIKAPRPRP